MDGASTNTLIIISLVGLIVVVVVHIFVIARWSGRVDASLESILRQPQMWTNDLTATASSIRAELLAKEATMKATMDLWVDEVKKLRDSTHALENLSQRHDSELRVVTQFQSRVERFMEGREQAGVR